jgi:hypothetical protein
MKLANAGKNLLIIRQLKSPNPIFTITSDKNEALKDDFITLTITLNSRNRRGNQNAIIEIITNDPANPKIFLNCTGDISQ